MIDRYKCTTIYTATILNLYIGRTVFKMSDKCVTSCICVAYFILYILIIINAITDKEAQVSDKDEREREGGRGYGGSQG